MSCPEPEPLSARSLGEPVRVVHLPERDYNDGAARRDWQKQGYATLAEMAGHPVLGECPRCSARPEETEHG